MIKSKNKIREELWIKACNKNQELNKEIEQLENQLYQIESDNYLFESEDI